MTASSTERRINETRTTKRLALAVADVNWFTTENLFRELQGPDVSALLLTCIDYVNAWRRDRRPWAWGKALAERSPRLWQRDLVLPSGWMKRFPSLGMRPIGRAIEEWRQKTAPDDPLALVMTYPHYLYLRDLVQPDLQVYFNVDDYSLYWPRWAEQVRLLELRAVREADLTVCVSRLRCNQLREAVPEAAAKIRHLPHGAPTISLGSGPHRLPAELPDDLVGLPGPRLGYIGSLEDRIDWPLLSRVANAFPTGSIVLIGRLGTTPEGAWQEDRRRCLEQPNVHALGWRPQESIAQYNAAFDVCLIPYRTDHPFNVACCPTKIMDYMATGRPIVSTDLPECLLYEDLFDVTSNAEAFIEAIRLLRVTNFDDGRAERRFDWAKEHSCRRMVEKLLGWME